MVFYQVPDHPEFYDAIVNQIDVRGADSDGEAVSVSVLWDTYDALAVERIVGGERMKRLFEMQKDAYVFTA